MMKKLLQFAVILLTGLTFGTLAGCSNDNSVDGVPTIEIKNVKSELTQDDGNTISFTIIPHDATGYGYACVTLDDFKANNYTLEKVADANQKEYVIKNLVASTAYIVIAQAYNGANTSELKTVRTSTPTSAPEVTITDIVPTADGISLKINASSGSTSITYAIYTEFEETLNADKDPDADGFVEWRKWKNVKIEADGNIISEKLVSDNYVIEAYATAGTVLGTHVKEKFAVMIQDRPYVKIGMINITSEDATILLTCNDKCKSYYAGIVKDAEFTSQKVLDIVNGPKKADYFKTGNYSGSLKSFMKDVSAWSAGTEIMLWIVPCDNVAGTPAANVAVIQGLMKVPARSYDSDIIASVSLIKKSYTSFEVSVKPADNCLEYYTFYGLADNIESDYTTDKALAEYISTTQPAQNGKLEQTFPQTDLEPGSKYGFYTVSVDTNGKIGRKPTREYITTDNFEFNSTATVSVNVQPSMSDAKVTFTNGGGCVSVRYLVLTTDVYAAQYSGTASRVMNVLALNKTADNVKSIAVSGSPVDVKLTSLLSDKRYLVFALPVDAQGKFGVMPKETLFATKSFDLTSTTTVPASNLKITFTSAGKKRVTFTATPSAGVKEYYIQLIFDNQTFSDNDLVQKLLEVSVQASIHVVGADGGDAPKYNYNKEMLSSSNYYIYILCKDADDKYNNPNASRTFVKML